MINGLTKSLSVGPWIGAAMATVKFKIVIFWVFKNILEDLIPFSGATDTPVLDL